MCLKNLSKEQGRNFKNVLGRLGALVRCQKTPTGQGKNSKSSLGRKIRRVKNVCILDSYATINHLHPTDLVMSNWMDILLQ